MSSIVIPPLAFCGFCFCLVSFLGWIHRYALQHGRPEHLKQDFRVGSRQRGRFQKAIHAAVIGEGLSVFGRDVSSDVGTRKISFGSTEKHKARAASFACIFCPPTTVFLGPGSKKRKALGFMDVVAQHQSVESVSVFLVPMFVKKSTFPWQGLPELYPQPFLDLRFSFGVHEEDRFLVIQYLLVGVGKCAPCHSMDQGGHPRPVMRGPYEQDPTDTIALGSHLHHDGQNKQCRYPNYRNQSMMGVSRSVVWYTFQNDFIRVSSAKLLWSQIAHDGALHLRNEGCGFEPVFQGWSQSIESFSCRCNLSLHRQEHLGSIKKMPKAD